MVKKMDIENNLKDILIKDYGLEVYKVDKNLESTAGNVYMVQTKNLKYFVKIYDDFLHVNQMINLHYVLNQNNLYIPKVVTSISNNGYTKFDIDKYIVVYSCLEGHQITWDSSKIKLTDMQIDKLGKTLRKLHNIQDNSKIQLPNLPFEKDIYEEDIRRSILHFDLTRNNIFIQNEKIGFIDFDDAKFGASVCDVAILIANLFFSKSKGANIDGMNKFIKAYYSNDEDKLRNKEILKIKQAALLWINYVLNGNEFDSSLVDSFEARKYLINKYL